MVTKAQKQEKVAQLKEQLSRSQITILSDYRGLTVKEMTQLRDCLREAGAEYTIAKNTLLKVAMGGEDAVKDLEPLLHGPTALVVGYEDPVAPTKALMKYLKESEKELPVIKGGVFEGRTIDVAELKQLADLPSREELLAKMLGSMQAPAQGLVMVLSGLTRNLVYVLEAIRQQKEKEQ